jgi:hypothetical protein
VLRAGGGAGEDEGDHAAVCHHEDRVPHRQRGARTVGFFPQFCTLLDTVLRIRILISFIPDPTIKTTKEGGENNCCFSFLFSYDFHKIKNYFIFE